MKPDFPALEKKILPRLTFGGLLALLLMAASLMLHLVNIGSLGDANAYYTAAVEAMLGSWSNFFFVAAEPGGSVTVDKPPLGLWVEAVFAYFLGVSGFSTTLPNVLAGVLGVGLLYHLVKAHMGELAGVTAALVMTLTPVFLATNRNNTMDGMLVFTLLLAAWAFLKATETGKLRWLLLGAWWVDLGFNIKMLQAFLPLPAFYALYFLGAKTGWFRKILQLGAATVLLAVVSLSWAVVVDGVPAESRPYIGSSGNNTVMGLIFGHNGAARLGNLLGRGNAPQTDPQPASASRAVAPLPPNPASKQSNPPIPPGGSSAGQPRPPQGPPPAALEACAGQTQGASCSFSQPNGNVIHGRCIMPPHTTALACAPQGAPPMQAPGVSSPGGTPFSNETGSPGVFRFFLSPLSKQMSWLLPFALMALVFTAFAARLRLPLEAEHKALLFWGGWLVTCLVFFSAVSGIFHAYYAIMLAPALGGAVGMGFAQLYRWSERSPWALAGLVFSVLVTLAFQFFAAAQYGEFSWWMFGTGLLVGLGILLGSVSRRAAYAVVLSAALVIPTYWSLMTVFHSANHNLPTAYEGRTQSGKDFLPKPPLNGEHPQDNRLLDFLQANTHGVKYLVAVPAAQQGAQYVLETGRPVLYMGGFGGQDEVVTAADLQAMVARGELRYVLYGGEKGQKAEIAAWITAACQVVKNATVPQTPPAQGLTLYDCMP